MSRVGDQVCAGRSAWPPNSERMADNTRFLKSALPREVQRAKRAAASTFGGDDAPCSRPCGQAQSCQTALRAPAYLVFTPCKGRRGRLLAAGRRWRRGVHTRTPREIPRQHEDDHRERHDQGGGTDTPIPMRALPVRAVRRVTHPAVPPRECQCSNSLTHRRMAVALCRERWISNDGELQWVHDRCRL
jgi:hypothetical protein